MPFDKAFFSTGAMATGSLAANRMPSTPRGDVIVDEGDLLVDIGLGRAVGLGVDIAELGGGVGDAFRGGVEIADADQLRNVDDGDLLALAVGAIRRLAAVIGLGCGCAGGAVAGQRIGRQIVAARPGRGRKAVPLMRPRRGPQPVLAYHV